MRTVELTIPGKPVAKARAKFRAVHTGVYEFNKHRGRKQEKVHVVPHTPAESAKYENLVRMAYVEVCRDLPPTDEFVVIDVVAYFQAPKSLRAADRVFAEDGVLPHGKKPDGDNILKAIKDGLRTVAYQDDRQVFDAHVLKAISNRPRCEVKITFLNQEEAVCRLRRQVSGQEPHSSEVPMTRPTSSSQCSLSLLQTQASS